MIKSIKGVTEIEGSESHIIADYMCITLSFLQIFAKDYGDDEAKRRVKKCFDDTMKLCENKIVEPKAFEKETKSPEEDLVDKLLDGLSTLMSDLINKREDME